MITKQSLIYALVAFACGGAGALTVTSLNTHRTQSAERIALSAPNAASGETEPAWETMSPNEMTAAIESLYASLNAEIDQRRALEGDIEKLQAALAALQDGARAVSVDTTEQAQVAEYIAEPMDRMTTFGFTQQDKKNFERMQGALQFKAIQLDDRARREGWQGTARHQEEYFALLGENNPVRQELGDTRYDEYLYATGQPNRLVVNSVVPSSPAENSGFQAGDVIVSYAGESIFSDFELRNIRSAGQAGELINVEVVRNGESMLLSIPRGPMGISSFGQNVDPRTYAADGGR
ncbi:MAG: PDZ domain-containing protein [Pseudomonadota bacterium]